jgi:hypothetical protein
VQIDRAAFLLLTAAIACRTKEPPRPVTTLDLPPPPAPVDASVPPPAEDAASTPVAEATVTAGSDDGEELETPFPGAATMPLARTIHGQTCDAADNLKGIPDPCLLWAPGPACESFSDTKAECQKLGRFLTPRAAQKTIECLRDKSGTADICLFNVGPLCFLQALGSVCVDTSPSVEATCQRVMQTCERFDARGRHVTLDGCKVALSAALPAKREAFATCVEESCSLVPCFYGFTSPH